MKSRSLVVGVIILLTVSILYATYRSQSNQSQPSEKAKTMQKNTVKKEKAPYYKVNNIKKVTNIRKKLEQSAHIVTIHHNSQDKSHYVKNEVAVKFNIHPGEKELKRIAAEIKGKEQEHHNNICIFKSNTMSAHELINYFSKRKDVKYAEPHYLLLPNVIPNDTFYPDYQWNMPMIDMEKAWDINKGRSDVIVAVVDTGIDLKHPEFKGRLVTGYNVLTGSSSPMDDNGHGTHVAGIIAAHSNNREGIAGMTWENKIMSIKGIGGDGSGSSIDIAKGIIWATDHGAKVINLSVGNYNSSNVLHDAITYAYGKDVVMIAATGNDNSSQPSYPATYPEVLGVSAVDTKGNRASFSNYGSSVSVVAPGVDIPSTYKDQDYAELSGTSMACPHVTGLAALIRSVNPGLKNEQVLNIIKFSSHDLGTPGRDDYYGYGLIDVPRALELTKAGYVQQSTRHAQPLRKKSFFEQLKERFFNAFNK